MATGDLRLQRAQQAIDSIGLGFDINQDLCFDNCKRSPRLIKIDEEECRDLKIPGGISIPNVPISIKCHTGESHRIQSEVLNLWQMSKHFNMTMRLAGDIPSGHFYASFGLSGNQMTDAAITKSLAYDGWFITRYSFELELGDGGIHDHVKEAVPSEWDPQALARFIKHFGTHIVFGVSMGGKDVLYIRREVPSYLEPTSLLKFLKDAASKRFVDSVENHCLPSEVLCNNNENITMIYNRRGGSGKMMSHNEWIDTVELEPDLISLLLLPLPSLLSGIRGSKFLSHVINQYQKYKPPIEELDKFLEFQLPKRWPPLHIETSFGFHWKNEVKSRLRLGILGPMLYINTIPVDVGNRPVTGLRLQLEGTRSNRLAINLQHLESLPESFLLTNKENSYFTCDSRGCKMHKKVKWNSFSYICTAPVESEDSLSVVTGAQLLVKSNCLRLRLRFSKVNGATLKKSPEWDQSYSNLVHQRFYIPVSKQNDPKPGEKTVGSSVYSLAHPSRVNPIELERFVNKSEIVRGAEHSPGYWVVSGAGLYIKNGRINLRVKYSLLNFVDNSFIAVPWMDLLLYRVHVWIYFCNQHWVLIKSVYVEI